MQPDDQLESSAEFDSQGEPRWSLMSCLAISPTRESVPAKDSPKRAEAFKKMAETFGVTVKELFWTQGRYDVVTILDAPDESSAMTLSLSLGA